MKVEKFFKAEDKKRIEDAIAKAESGTSGEIVPVVVESSDQYPHVYLAGGFLGQMVALAVGVWVLPHPDYLSILALLASGFVVGVFAGRFITPLRRLLLGKNFAEGEVYQRALQAFYESGVSRTRDHTGILIFVSLLEHRVQVLADTGISDKAPEGYWDEVVNLLLTGIKEKDPAGGIANAVDHCGEILSKHFPPRHDDTNELPDKLILN